MDSSLRVFAILLLFKILLVFTIEAFMVHISYITVMKMNVISGSGP